MDDDIPFTFGKMSALAERNRLMTKSQVITAFVVLFSICLLSACAAGPNLLKDSQREDGSVAGFWAGLWHGMIVPITFLISLFNDSVCMYEVHNSGGWYNFGFLLGAGIIWGGGAAGAASGESKE
jgi:hypothetical protein